MPASRDSDHASRMKQEAKEEQEMEKERKKTDEVHIDAAADRVLHSRPWVRG